MRLRLTFTKDEPLRYISNLDVLRLWERAFRRAGVPIAYSGGFNPRPRMVIASALPLGITGREELMDVWLDALVTPEEFVRRVSAQLPTGVRLLAAQPVAKDAPSLPAQVRAAEYRVAVEGVTKGAVEERVRQLLAATSLPRERRGKVYDLRPLVEELEVVEEGGTVYVAMRLRAEAGATGRPDEVLRALGLSAFARGAERLRLLLSPEGCPDVVTAMGGRSRAGGHPV